MTRKQDCPICWLPISRRQSRKNPAFFFCNHRFHPRCIQEWNTRSPGCPICHPPAPVPEEEGPKNCPGCQVSIIKIGGCDNMICTICETNFRWNDLSIYERPVSPPINWFRVLMRCWFLLLFVYPYMVYSLFSELTPEFFWNTCSVIGTTWIFSFLCFYPIHEAREPRRFR